MQDILTFEKTSGPDKILAAGSGLSPCFFKIRKNDVRISLHFQVLFHKLWQEDEISSSFRLRHLIEILLRSLLK